MKLKHIFLFKANIPFAYLKKEKSKQPIESCMDIIYTYIYIFFIMTPMFVNLLWDSSAFSKQD
jgi:hypothetical protein